LQSGVAEQLSLPALNYRNYYIDVPVGATRLTVTLTMGTGELDLFLKFGSPLSGGTYQDLVNNSDFRSDALNTPDEQIEVTKQSTPPLKEGRWYVVPVNFNETETSLTLTATVETPSGGGGDGGGGGATGLSGDGTAKLSLVSNDNFFVPWGRLRLAYRTKVFKQDARGDLYLALVLDNGPLFFLNKGFGLSASVVPFYGNAQLSDGETDVLDIELPDDFYGFTISLYGVFARSGKSPLDLSNWISNLSYVTLYFGEVSGDQLQIRSLRGDPQFMKVEYLRDRKIRREIWGYPGSQVFRFVNGSLQESPREMAPAAAGEPKNRLLNFDRILTRPTTKLLDFRKTFGDPDRVVEGPDQGTKIWVFDKAGITVRSKNDAIYSVEVY
jgi:hypothetical protein